MKRTTNFNKNNVLGVFVALFIGFLSLQGCSSSGGGTTTPADPKGYYTGTATVKTADESTVLELTDLQALINGDRFMIMSKNEALLYDATITSISGNSYQANVTIYKDGENPVTTTVSGTITEGTTITGTIAGVGFGDGTFTLNYDDSNSDTSSIAAIVENWQGGPNESSNSAVLAFSINDQGDVTYLDNLSGSIVFICTISSGSTTPISESSLYAVGMSFQSCFFDTVDSSASGVYTGLATLVLRPNLVDGQPDVLTLALVMMYANPSHSVITEATVVPPPAT